MAVGLARSACSSATKGALPVMRGKVPAVCQPTRRQRAIVRVAESEEPAAVAAPSPPAPAPSPPLPVAAPAPPAPVAAVPVVSPPVKDPKAGMKSMLLDSLVGTDRGLSASGEVRAEINEQINQVEGMESGVDTTKDINGVWELLYTNSPDLLAVLAIGYLPLSPVKIGAVIQVIDSASGTVENKVQLQLPGLETSLATVATYEVASPKRLQYTIVRGVVQTPQLLSSLEFPSTATVMGQTVDLTLLKNMLQPLTKTAEGFAASVTDILSQTPNPTFDLPGQAQSANWQLNTYVDESLRIARSDGGGVFVFKKKVVPVS